MNGDMCNVFGIVVLFLFDIGVGLNVNIMCLFYGVFVISASVARSSFASFR